MHLLLSISVCPGMLADQTQVQHTMRCDGWSITDSAPVVFWPPRRQQGESPSPGSTESKPGASSVGWEMLLATSPR